MNNNNIKSLVGLINKRGENSCFLNSILQIIFHIKPLSSYMELTFRHSNIALFKSISLLFQNYNIKENEKPKEKLESLKTSEIRAQLQQMSNNVYKINECCDPVELLDFLFNNISKYSLGRNILSKLFLIKSETILQCQNNHQTNLTVDNFVFPIYIKQIIDDHNSLLSNNDYAVDKLFLIEKSIHHSSRKECEKCKLLMQKKIICKTLPSYFLVSLVWDRERPLINNVHHILKMIPHQVNLHTDVFDNENIPNNNDQYAYHYLFSLLLFSYKEQHYVSMINKGDNWTFYNDEQVFNHKFLKILEMLLSYEFYPVFAVYKEKTTNTNINLKQFDDKLKELNDINAMRKPNEQNKNNSPDNLQLKKRYVPYENIIEGNCNEGTNRNCDNTISGFLQNN